jgi:hypothetical protein
MSNGPVLSKAQPLSLCHCFSAPRQSFNTTKSFGRDDLLVLAKVAERAFDRIHELQQVGQGVPPTETERRLASGILPNLASPPL